MLDYNSFINESSSVVVNGVDHNINHLIDNAYKYFKGIGKPVNTLDIISYVEMEIGREIDDKDYNDLYYRITGEEFDGDEIYDLEDEEKFIIG